MIKILHLNPVWNIFLIIISNIFFKHSLFHFIIIFNKYLLRYYSHLLSIKILKLLIHLVGAFYLKELWLHILEEIGKKYFNFKSIIGILKISMKLNDLSSKNLGDIQLLINFSQESLRSNLVFLSRRLQWLINNVFKLVYKNTYYQQ
jgi:hypothetical protein